MCCSGRRKVPVAKLCTIVPWLNRKHRKRISLCVKSDIYDDCPHPHHEKIVYRTIQPIYQQLWMNFILSTLRFVLEGIVLLWAAHKVLVTDYGTPIAYANKTNEDCNSTNIVDSNWKFWLLWANTGALITLIWLLSVVVLNRIYMLVKTGQWRPGAGKPQFREIIFSLVAVKQMLEGITVTTSCLGLLMSLCWIISTWYSHECPTTTNLNIDPIIGLFITPWIVLAAAIVFNARLCCSKIYLLTSHRQRLRFRSCTEIQMTRRLLRMSVVWPIVREEDRPLAGTKTLPGW